MKYEKAFRVFGRTFAASIVMTGGLWHSQSSEFTLTRRYLFSLHLAEDSNLPGARLINLILPGVSIVFGWSVKKA